MRKYLLILVILISTQHLFSQSNKEKIVRREIDSLKNILPGLRDSARVDCLNTLASKYSYMDLSWKQYLDSSSPFSIMANDEAKKIGYKKGLGYSYLRLANLEKSKVHIYQEQYKKHDPALLAAWEKYLRLAILTGEQINDHTILGKAYTGLFLKTWENGDSITLKNNFKKAVSFLEQAGKQNQTGNYSEADFATCRECVGNELWLGGIYATYAYMYGDEGTWVTALPYMKIAMKYFEKTADKERLADAYWKLGDILFRTNDHEAAVEACKKSISFYHEIGDTQAEISSYIFLSKIFELKGDFENGVEYGKKNILLSEKFVRSNLSGRGGNRATGQAFVWMSNMYKIAGDYETALDIIRKGRNYYSNPIDSVSNAYWKAAIGNVHRLLGNFDSAKYYLVPFTNSVNDINNLGKTKLGYLYIDLKEYDKALEVITPLVLYLKKIKRIMPPLANCLMISASAYLGKKDYKTALQFAREALADLRIMKGRVMMIQNYKLLSDIFSKLGNVDSAYYYLGQYTTLKDSLINRQFFWKLNSYKKEAEEERKTSQINLLNKDNQLKEQKLRQEAFVKNGLFAGMLLLFLLGVFIFRNLLLKRKNEKLRLQKDLEMQKLESEKKHAELQQQALELEMQALRAQMNPHFIFNCLNSINRFIFKNETKVASDYLTRFSRLIRMVLLHSQKKLVPLEDELEMLKLYLDMERLRFKNAFDYHITTTNAIENSFVFIPPLLLQPFCENAIWHGLMHKDGPGHLNIELNEDNGILYCIITDDGIGREKAEEFKSKSAEKEKSMGLKITKERLSLLNQGTTGGTFYEIEDVRNEQGDIAGTKVELKIRYKDTVEEYV